MTMLESDITAAGRKIKRLQREIDLLRQLNQAYREVIESPNDITAGIALGSALAAWEHFSRNTETARRLAAHLEQIDQLPDYDYEAVEQS